MRATRSISVNKPNAFTLRISAYRELVKFRLSFLVAFSSAFGYALAQPQQINWLGLLWLSLAGFLLSGASITINQVLEQKYDAKMKRTQNRPLPTGKISSKEAIAFAVFLGFGSLLILWFTTNPLTVLLALVSMVLYSFVYTPLKRVGPIAVFVGAIPGALPPLLGWVAVSGVFSVEAVLVFAIQFVWQFPHFWAIAWVADEDYQKAGFKLLPGAGQKDMRTAAQIMTYTMLLLP
ncbi:MAG: heme o synthase, partial [Bacteroidota bacterium]